MNFVQKTEKVREKMKHKSRRFVQLKQYIQAYKLLVKSAFTSIKSRYFREKSDSVIGRLLKPHDAIV